MGGIGSKMKKRPFPDEEEREEAPEADLAGDEEAPARPPAGESMDGGEGDEDEEVFDEETADTEEEVGEAQARGMGGKPPASQPESPEDQAAYERFVRNGMRLIYDEKTLPGVIESLDGAGNPIEGLGVTVASVVERLVASATKAGKQLSPSVVMHGAGELLEQLAELSAASGRHEYSDEERMQVMKMLVTAGKGQAAKSAAAPQQPQPGPAPRGLGAAMQPPQAA